MRMIFIYHAHDFCAALRQNGRKAALAEARKGRGKVGNENAEPIHSDVSAYNLPVLETGLEPVQPFLAKGF